MSARCCGSELQVIRLSEDRPGRPGVALHRCASCGARGYVRGAGDTAELLEPSAAFAALAGTFGPVEGPRVAEPGSTPRRTAEPTSAKARAARAERAALLAAQTAERAALRAAARAAKTASGATAEGSAAPADAASTVPAQRAAVDVTDLADLLSSWTVLGAVTR